jgi:AcrR family transcriptional regulator
MARQSERSAATIEGVLGAAQRLFMTRGFDAVSIDEIAAAAGIAKGGFYHHFSSKQSVFEAVLDRVQAELAVSLNRALNRTRGSAHPKLSR